MSDATIPDAIRRHLHELMVDSFRKVMVESSSRTRDRITLRAGVQRITDIAEYIDFDLSSTTAVRDNDLYDYVTYAVDVEGEVTNAQTMAEALDEVAVRIKVILDREAKSGARTKRGGRS